MPAGGRGDRFLGRTCRGGSPPGEPFRSQFGTTPAQVALAWLIARPSITAPIASTTSIAQLDEIIGAARLKLDADAIKRLNEASA